MHQTGGAKTISAIWLILPVIVVGLSSRELILMRKRSGFTYDSKALPGWEKDLPQIARNHMQVNGVLAGFSITVVVLIAGLMLEGGAGGLGFPEQFALGKLMVAFFGYVATAILFSIVSARPNLHRFFLFFICLSLVSSFGATKCLCSPTIAGYSWRAISKVTHHPANCSRHRWRIHGSMDPPI